MLSLLFRTKFNLHLIIIFKCGKKQYIWQKNQGEGSVEDVE
jgi:hypothetical protein